MSANPLQARTQEDGSLAPARRARGEQRRRRIFRALHDCIIAKGYSNTTLADIATSADMSPSHLLYYFSGKERILEEYFAAVADRFLAHVATISEAPAADQGEMLADLWFGGEAGNREEIGFMLECFGEAVHDGEMRRTKAEFDRHCKTHLEGVMANAPAGGRMSSAEAAEIAYSLLTGLRNSVYFDEAFTVASARRIFCQTLNNLRGGSAGF